MPAGAAEDAVRRAEPLPEASFRLVLTVSRFATQVPSDPADADGLEDDGKGLRLNASETRDERVRLGDDDVRLVDYAAADALPHLNLRQKPRHARDHLP